MGAHKAKVWQMEDADLNRIVKALMADGLVERIAEILRPQVIAPLMTRAELAADLRVRPAQVDRLVKRGMPRQYVGHAPRFDALACRAWLQRNPPRGVTSDEPLPGIVRRRRRARGG